MANFNITDLAAVASIGDADLFEVQQGGVNKKVTGAQIKTYLGVGIGGLFQFQGNFTITTVFPSGAQMGYSWFCPTASTSLLAHDGGVIAAGSLIISKVNGASTSSNADWIIIPTQY